MNNQGRSQRRLLNLKVNRAVQVGMIIRISCILFVCLLLCSGVYYVLANQEIAASYNTFHIKAQNFLDFLLPAIIGSFVVSLVAGMIASLFFPRNYAGGLYAIERDLKKIIGGDLNARVRLRRGDAALPLAVTVNDLIDFFKEKLSHTSAGLARAQDVFTATGLPQDAQLAELKKIVTALQDEINNLKIAGDK
ncbi:MAG: hypothetical protein HY885_12010 [Deltaproteobacteria bacterium]|nr:hypothetical protein [Deltaproteobacteria bacterium]